MRKYLLFLGMIALTVSVTLNTPFRIQALTGGNRVMHENESQKKNQQSAQLPTESSTVPGAKEAFDRAREHDMKDQIDEAISEYTRAIELDPNYVEAYYSRSAVLAKDHAQKALEDARKAQQFFIKQGNQFGVDAMESHMRNIQRGMDEGIFKNNPI
jgi:tetratricopeptide (TPR) repeat protein